MTRINKGTKNKQRRIANNAISWLVMLTGWVIGSQDGFVGYVDVSKVTTSSSDGVDAGGSFNLFVSDDLEKTIDQSQALLALESHSGSGS